MTTELLQGLVSGLLVGCVYALLGVGFSLTWGAIGVINVAHAAFAVLAAYFAYFSYAMLKIDPLLTLIIIIPLFFVIGIVLHETLIRSLFSRSATVGFSSMVMTFGIAVALENVMVQLFTADPRILKTPYTGISISFGPVYISGGHLSAAILSVIILGLLYIFLYWTYTGRAVRAVEQDREGAALSGVNQRRVNAITFGVGIASAGVAGVALSLIYPFEPAAHMSWLIYVFLVVISGGVGSMLGTGAAGLFTGLVVGLSGVWVPYAWVNLVLFSLLILIMTIRPKGVFS